MKVTKQDPHAPARRFAAAQLVKDTMLVARAKEQGALTALQYELARFGLLQRMEELLQAEALGQPPPARGEVC